MSSTQSDPAAQSAGDRPEAPILFQQYFKAGPRTYAAQVKQASNGKPFLVLTEGRRQEKDEQVRKSRILVFSENFGDFFRMLQETAEFIKANRPPEDQRPSRNSNSGARPQQQPRGPVARRN